MILTSAVSYILFLFSSPTYALVLYRGREREREGERERGREKEREGERAILHTFLLCSSEVVGR